MTSSNGTTSSVDGPLGICLWVHPRSTSTAFARALLQRKDTHYEHEPVTMVFYHSAQRANFRFGEEACAQSEYYDATIEGVMQDMLKESRYGKNREGRDAVKFVFIKDMAQSIFSADTLAKLYPKSKVYRQADTRAPKSDADRKDVEDLRNTLENPTVVPIDLLRRYRHAFLMRTPEKTIPSYYKCTQEGAGGFTFWDSAEAGYAEIRILYQWMSNPESSWHKAPISTDDAKYPGRPVEQPAAPPLIDSATLLADPEKTLAHWCKALGVPFEPTMLKWEDKKVKEFSSWGSFHDVAEHSTGFDKSVEAPKKDHCQEVLDGIEECRADYEWLHARRTISADDEKPLAS
ncbi:Branched chain aminotransferase BCAT1, pyridoxal phosphate enzymes type IV superfamily [Ceraceosorus bombacis]|uniref:Branched chain aminotransferase BCAT1, pyridoxal phosphate enzymes type IV superfamily n=1 Tax=Ceraceosorus bombacis TaxID=401625 RepID=A0A0P1BLP2_9BASI|nr:Branched chain aminotransferase BCAT1, pyridoxal phosphate enzymes type IV superfamily [Ceraceosorus bombacis]